MSLAAAFCAATLVAAGGIDAHARESGTSADRIVLAQRNGASLGEAIEQVRRQYNGRIVSAETRVSGNREVHHIKILTEDGKVKTVRIPGRSRGA